MSQPIEKILNFAHTRPLIFSLLLMTFSGFCLVQSLKTLFPPPEIVTHYRFTVIEQRIRLFLHEHQNREVILQALPAIPGEDNCVTDGWNYPIRYEHLDLHTHKLLSYGQDGVPGGKPDLPYQFRVI